MTASRYAIGDGQFIESAEEDIKSQMERKVVYGDVMEPCDKNGLELSSIMEVVSEYGVTESELRAHGRCTGTANGMPDCRVFRYWEDGFPLRTQGAEMRALVLARDGKAMIALGNYGPARAETYTVRLRLDLKALGLSESVQAHDVEIKAGRAKATHPQAAGMPAQPAELKRLAPGVFELTIPHHDFTLIAVE